jgi:hypothetical protein
VSFLEVNRSLGLGPVQPRTYGVRRVIPPQRPPGARDGSFPVPAPLPWADTRPPAMNVSSWTPWGWVSPLPGQTLERF